MIRASTGLLIGLLVNVISVYLAINYTDLIDDGPIKVQKLFYLTSMLVAVDGVVLGGFYFFARIDYENRRDQYQRWRNKNQILLDLLDSYNDHINKIFYLNIKGDSDLQEVRTKISRKFSLIENFLELGEEEKESNYSKVEIDTLLRVFSFADNNSLLTSNFYSFSKLEKERETLSAIEAEYFDLFKDTHRILLIKSYK